MSLRGTVRAWGEALGGNKGQRHFREHGSLRRAGSTGGLRLCGGEQRDGGGGGGEAVAELVRAYPAQPHAHSRARTITAA